MCCDSGLYPASLFFFFQAEDGIRDYKVTGVQTCALPISPQVCSHLLHPRSLRGRTQVGLLVQSSRSPRGTVEEYQGCALEARTGRKSVGSSGEKANGVSSFEFQVSSRPIRNSKRFFSHL